MSNISKLSHSEHYLPYTMELWQRENPYGIENTEAIFINAMRENIKWHSSRNLFYAQFLYDRGFRYEEITTDSDCASIPFIHTNLFKKRELLSVVREEIVLHLTSSGTTGQKSQVFFDEQSAARGGKMVDTIFNYYGWNTPEKPANYLLFTYEPLSALKVGTVHTDMSLCKYAPVNRSFFALKADGMGGHSFDVYGCIRTLQEYAEEGLPLRMFGFPSFLHFTLERMKQLGVKPLSFPADSLVFLGGGWKGYADKQVAKKDLYAAITDQLGIPDERCRDGFGSAEHSVPYVECKKHRFHVPIWSRVFIRDVKTLKQVQAGQAGYLHVVTPHMTSMPVSSLLMGDLAIMGDGGSCGCGIETPYFEIAGRAGITKNRSCAVAAAELIGRDSA